ncbi:cytochrome P450 [Cubamyces sp. BRFM 1775]|nr:cytochrome P450 [Cubamyces sp. BRFM 1775]
MSSLTTLILWMLGVLAFRILGHSILSIFFSPLRTLRGPPTPSVLYGHVRQICRAGNAATMREWVERYGRNIYCRYLLQVPCLWTADPLVMRHVLQSGNFSKPWETRASAAKVIGDGVLVAEGDRHRGQRAVMNPAFGAAQIREFVPIFIEKAAEAYKIATHGVSAKIDVLEGLKKMTLDVIGLAGFDYHLEALNALGKPNELNEAFYQLFSSTPPLSIQRLLVDNLPFLDWFPDQRAKTIRTAQAAMRRIGMELIQDRKAAIAREFSGRKRGVDKKDLPGKDLLTLLIKANMAMDIPEHQRLSDEEVLSQIPTFLVAGHETTSTAAAWCLFALTQSPDAQAKLREELLALNSECPSMDELASLPYLDCVVRETLRLHTPVAFTLRAADRDDVIPVSEPFVDRQGHVQREIRIGKGNRIIIAILALNQSKAIWGDDALEFRPERWADPPKEAADVPGVWSNMMTFSGGPRACIGFRFSIAELKALIFTLVRAFEFELACAPEDVTMVGMFTQRPAVSSEPAKGAQMPLIVRPYSR